MASEDLDIEACKSDDLAGALGLEHRGPVRTIHAATTSQMAREDSLAFLAASKFKPACETGTLIVGRSWVSEVHYPQAAMIIADDPRLAFAKALQHLRPERVAEVSASAVIASDAHVDPTADIGPFVVIESGASIGAGSRLRAGVVVRAGVEIGDEVEVAEHVVLGNDGLTVPVDEEGRAVMMRHLGGLSIGRGVHIGPNTTVGRGTLDQAEIGEGCVIGPQVNIGHNTRIEPDCILTGGCRLAGGVRLGRGAWIGTGAVIHQKVKVGAGAVVGGGAVITRDVPDQATIAAVPGASPRDVAQLRRLLQRKG